MLLIHRAERADGLAGALAEVVRTPLDDPMEPEVVSVPTRGIERWLAQTLSMTAGASQDRADGVCANVVFPFPGRLVGDALAGAVGVERNQDPWLPSRALWPLLDVVESAVHEPAFSALRSHIGSGQEEDARQRARRLGAVRHIVDLFDRYAVHRPEMVRGWAAGEDGGWQGELWRRLREAIGVPSPAERLPAGCEQLRTDPQLADLPARFSVFGLTRLPASYLHVLAALAAHRDVHVFLLHPSLALWDRIAGGLSAEVPRRRVEDFTAATPQHPLLASWGRDAREMQLVVAGSGVDAIIPPGRQASGQAGTTLLARVQAEIRADASPPGLPMASDEDRRAVLDPRDRSIQIHSCHGRARQVEVLRDAVRNLLADDPTLEPRDVIIMCPDVESFAPLIHATFGVGAADDADAAPPEGDLRVRLADRSLRQTNPILGLVSELLELARGRMTASQVLDLADRPPVRRRFRFDDDELQTIGRWAADAGVRWGLDASDRAVYKLETVAANTWRSGWDRVLLGVAMADEGERVVGGVVPLDDVSSGAIGLAGRFAELLERLTVIMRSFTEAKPITGWVDAIASAADMFTDTRDEDRWQREQLARLLDEVLDEATVDGTLSGVELTLPEVTALLADQLRGRPTRASFRTGNLTACTLVPMRSVPHRVVCLAGLDDGAFPRIGAGDGDDLLLADPHVGDRDPRSEDRQLLLDALLSATETLVITYTGRDERTNLERPPSVPVGELLDVIDGTVRLPGNRDGHDVPASEQIVIEHPLQAFDARNFTAGALVPDVPWSHDRVALGGALAAAAATRPAEPFLAHRLPPVHAPVIDLDDLVRFAQHPVRAFLRQRLGVPIGGADDEAEDAMPIQLDGLKRWAIGQRTLQARLGGASDDACRAAETARGDLPPGALGRQVLDGIMDDVQALVDAVAKTGVQWSQTTPQELRVELADGRLIVGAVPGVHGATALTAIFSRLGASHRLEAWVRLLALAAGTAAAQEAVMITIGKARRGTGTSRSEIRIDAAAAATELETLVGLFDHGLREPLPIFCRSSAAYAAAARADHDAGSAATREWASSYEWPKEDVEPANRLALGGVRTFDELVAAAPLDDEAGVGWAMSEQTRFGRLARRLWDPLLVHEEITDA